MHEELILSVAIVLYKEERVVLQNTVNSFLQIPVSKKLYLIDNSPTDVLRKVFNNNEIEYIFVGKNIGFAAAHNFVLPKISSTFHLVLNPDILFNGSIITSLITKLNLEKEVAFISPKILYPNNEVQFVCRKHPTPFDIINRRLKLFSKQIFLNEYQDLNLNKQFYPDFIHGCFMFFKTKEFKAIKGFDERYFLYMEDADICREIQKNNKKILYFPEVTIVHQHQKGSAKSLKLFYYHLSSALKYFIKWGF